MLWPKEKTTEELTEYSRKSFEIKSSELTMVYQTKEKG